MRHTFEEISSKTDNLQDFPGYPGAGFCICEGMVVVLEVITTEFRDGMQLMVLCLWECLARSDAGAVERIIRVVHLVSAEDSLQTTLIESLVMGYEGKSLDQWLYLLPNFREDGGILCILTRKTMYLGTPIVIVVGLWFDQ